VPGFEAGAAGVGTAVGAGAVVGTAVGAGAVVGCGVAGGLAVGTGVARGAADGFGVAVGAGVAAGGFGVAVGTGVGSGVGFGVGGGVGCGVIVTVGPVTESVNLSRSAASKTGAQLPTGSVVDASKRTPFFHRSDVVPGAMARVEPATTTRT
jgi:hypothetical protein